MTKQRFQPRQAAPVNERTAIVGTWIHLHLGKHESCRVITDCAGSAGFQIWSYRDDATTWEQLAARQKENDYYRVSIKLACEDCLKALFREMLPPCDDQLAQSLANVLTEGKGARSALNYRDSDALDKPLLAFCHRPTVTACAREIVELGKPLRHYYPRRST